MGLGKIGKLALSGVTGGLSLGKDALFGKKDPGTPDRNVTLDQGLYELTNKIRPMQTELAESYNSSLKSLNRQSPEALAKLTMQNQLKQNVGAARDAERLAESQVARRGLNRSSVGLNAIINAGSQARDRAGSIRASLPMLQNQMEAQKVAQLGGINQGLAGIIGTKDQSRAFIQGQASTGRGGGLFGLATGLAGAALAAKAGGNPMQGMQSGMSLGNAVGNMRLA